MNKHRKISLKYILICLFVLAAFVMPNLTSSPILSTMSLASTKVSKPAINVQEGSYFDSKTIKLSCKTKGATIYYTTDGTQVTKNSKVYKKPFKITKNCYVRAIAIKDGFKSNELIKYYQIYSYEDIGSDVRRYTLAIQKNKINKLNQTDQKICNKVNKIMKDTITEDMTKYQKVKAIHDYIINHTVYDYENYSKNTLPEVSYTIEGVLLNGKAVCQGYAETFQLFMNLLGIENKLISGYANGGGHAWNLVKFKDNWYHVDTTWDDPISQSGDVIQYNYFLISDRFISIDHDWTAKNYPACTSDDLMYKIYKGIIIPSIKNYQKKFTELYNKGLRTITILYPENKIPDLQFYYSLTGKNRCSYSYPVKFGDYYMFTVYVDS